MDRARIGACAVDERQLLGPVRSFEPAPLRKHGCVFTLDEAAAQESSSANLATWCEALVHRHERDLLRATLDVPVSPLPAHLRVSGVLWLWLRGPLPELAAASRGPPAATTLNWLAFDSVETAPEALRD